MAHIVPFLFSLEDLVQRSQIQVGETIHEVCWDSRNRQVIVLGKGLVTTTCLPESGTLRDVLEALGYADKSYTMDWSSIARNSLDYMHAYTQAYNAAHHNVERSPATWGPWMAKNIKNRAEEVLNLPLEVDVQSTLTL